MSKPFKDETNRSGGWFEYEQQRTKTMELPLFPLKQVVLFPGMVLPLHIFEMRYREMISRCIEEKRPFGVVLIDEGEEVGDAAKPHRVGTLAKIVRVERMDDGRMNITAIGLERFRIQQIHTNQSYLTATVEVLATFNGSTKVATELAQKLRPRLVHYVDLLATVNNTPLQLDRLPEDPTTLAFLTAIALQVEMVEKQPLLETQGVPELLVKELNLLAHENMLLQYMLETQREVQAMNGGITGGIFPN
ncbi:MAG: LON peptidase substrate-binding domain-containing protein [Caldilineaceae bacterium]